MAPADGGHVDPDRSLEREVLAELRRGHAEVIREVAALQATLNAGADRRAAFDDRMAELQVSLSGSQEQLRLHGATLSRIDAVVGRHFEDHRAMTWGKRALAGSAGALLTMCVGLLLAVTSFRTDVRDMAVAVARADTTVADVALMTIACDRPVPLADTAASPLARTAYRLDCASATAAVRVRLDGLLYR